MDPYAKAQAFAFLAFLAACVAAGICVAIAQYFFKEESGKLRKAESEGNGVTLFILIAVLDIVLWCMIIATGAAIYYWLSTLETPVFQWLFA